MCVKRLAKRLDDLYDHSTRMRELRAHKNTENTFCGKVQIQNMPKSQKQQCETQLKSKESEKKPRRGQNESPGPISETKTNAQRKCFKIRKNRKMQNVALIRFISAGMRIISRAEKKTGKVINKCK